MTNLFFTPNEVTYLKTIILIHNVIVNHHRSMEEFVLLKENNDLLKNEIALLKEKIALATH